MVIEDDVDVGDALTLSLQTWGAHVTRHHNAAEALASLAGSMASAPPDLIISDQRLGDGLGVEVIAQCRQHWKQSVPALIVTGDTSAQDMRLLAESGIPTLHKPFDADTLTQAVCTLLEAD